MAQMDYGCIATSNDITKILDKNLTAISALSNTVGNKIVGQTGSVDLQSTGKDPDNQYISIISYMY